jgi:hypothetical protein
MVREEDRRNLLDIRFTDPTAIRAAAAKRRRPPALTPRDRLLIIAADHPARGALNVGSDAIAMGDRFNLLDRLAEALSVPGANGLLATPDIVEDLLLLGALDDKYVFGSMNRGGFPGSVFELDDRFTAYSAASIVEHELEGGKVLLRMNYSDAGTVSTVEAASCAVTELAATGRIAILEPFLNTHVNGRPQNDLSPDAVIKSMAICSALGATSAYTWLKIPVVAEMQRVVNASTLPLVLLGGERSDDPKEMLNRWRHALSLDGVRGLAVGRNLLYPSDGDITGAVTRAVDLL